MTDASWHFACLPLTQKAEAVHRMAIAGHSENTIAMATGLSIEFVRQVLGERPTVRMHPPMNVSRGNQ